MPLQDKVYTSGGPSWDSTWGLGLQSLPLHNPMVKCIGTLIVGQLRAGSFWGLDLGPHSLFSVCQQFTIAPPPNSFVIQIYSTTVILHLWADNRYSALNSVLRNGKCSDKLFSWSSETWIPQIFSSENRGRPALFTCNDTVGPVCAGQDPMGGSWKAGRALEVTFTTLSWVNSSCWSGATGTCIVSAGPHGPAPVDQPAHPTPLPLDTAPAASGEGRVFSWCIYFDSTNSAEVEMVIRRKVKRWFHLGIDSLHLPFGVILLQAEHSSWLPFCVDA